MTTLHEFLAPTMLRTAAPDAKLEFGATVKMGHKKEQKNTGSWSYKFDMVGGSPTLTELGNYMKAHKHSMPVCDEISWRDPTVQVYGTDFILPLSPGYIIGRHTSFSGTIKANSTHEFWQLGAELDRSFQVIFGYQLRGGGAVEPLDEKLCKASDFKERFMTASPLPEEPDYQKCLEESWGGDPSLECGQSADLYVDYGRVLVVVSF